MATGNALARGVYVVAAKRTAFGTFGGSLKAHTPTDLSVIILGAELLYESLCPYVCPYASGLTPEQINSVCIGNVLSQSIN